MENSDDSSESVVSDVELPEVDLTRDDGDHEAIENQEPVGEDSSRDGMSDVDASDVPPLGHSYDEPVTMPARILVVKKALESFDSIDLSEVFLPVVMKAPPKLLTESLFCRH